MTGIAIKTKKGYMTVSLWIENRLMFSVFEGAKQYPFIEIEGVKAETNMMFRDRIETVICH